MAREAKAHRSLRFDNDVLDDVMRLKEPDETFTHVVNRLLAVGIRATDSGTQAHAEKHETQHKSTQQNTETEHGEHTAQYLEYLEKLNERLLSDIERYRADIAVKDKQIAQALERAQELAAQSNALALTAWESKRVPETTGDEITVVMNGEEIAQEPIDETPVEKEQPAEPEKRGFWSRFF